jgi:aspartate aminotransferase-like enzyme
MTTLPYRLRLPGPTSVPERVRQAMAQPTLNHRGPEFIAILDRVEELMKPILGTRCPVMFFAGSGTGVMEASLANTLSPGDRLLVCVNGQFGERFAAIGRALGAQVDTLEVPWGHAIDPNAIERRVAATNYRAVVVVHNESSTGVVADLAAIGEIVRNRPTLLIVDSVSGLGGMEMRQDEWGIDIVVSASQKALMCPPGAALVSVSPKAWEVVKKDDGLPRFYWDFRKAMNGGESLETPFTPPISLIYGLHEALEMIHSEGLPEVLARHKRLAATFRAGCNALGLPSFQQTDALSSTVVVLQVPEKLNGSDIVRLLYERHRTVIAGSRNKLAGRVIRIGCMGDIRDADIVTDLEHLDNVLNELRTQVATNAR